MTSPTPNQKSVSQILGELAGAASLCWMPKPIGIFDSTTASKFVDDAVEEIELILEAERKVAESLDKDLDNYASDLAFYKGREVELCKELSSLQSKLKFCVEMLGHIKQLAEEHEISETNQA